MCSLAMFWASCFLEVDSKDSSPVVYISHSNVTRAPELVERLKEDKDVSAFISLFFYVLRDFAGYLDAPGNSKEGDILVFLLFELLACGSMKIREKNVKAS